MKNVAAKLKLVPGKKADSKNLPVVCVIPGGPGLSSATLMDLEILSRSFDVAFIDPPGTGGSGELSNPTLEGILLHIEAAIKSLGRPVILVGHSFAGIYIAELSLRKNLQISGLVFLAAPLTSAGVAAVGSNYAKNMNAELNAAEKAWTERPSSETFREWMLQCMFFPERCREKGRALIMNDATSYKTFSAVRTAWVPSKNHVERISQLDIPRLLIAGDDDKILPPGILLQEAEATKTEFSIIKNACHFLTLEQPQSVARLIENKFSGSKGVKKP